MAAIRSSIGSKSTDNIRTASTRGGIRNVCCSSVRVGAFAASALARATSCGARRLSDQPTPGACARPRALERSATVCTPKRDRKSVVQGKRVSVRVDLGGRRSIKYKNHTGTAYDDRNQQKY